MKPRTIQRVEQAVFDAYLHSGLAQTVNDIGERSNVSATAIRNVLRVTKRLSMTKVEVPVMAKGTPGRVHQYREIAAYYPTRQWLVEVIKTERAEYEHRRQYGH